MTSRSTIRRSPALNDLFGIRSLILGLARAATLAGWTPTNAAPLSVFDLHDEVPEVQGRDAWPLYVASLALVLLGGAFAGLTIALMGQDGIYLQVLAEDANDSQSKNADRVLRLLRRGKHWVLVTLLLSNVIVNESLPVVLDRCLGGGVAAVVGSTVLIVIFGEVLPQSVCVRYGLPIGAYMSYPVLLLMYLMAPVAWPTAKLLDWLLGEDHGTVYKKSGLKTLVGLHQSLGEAHERLNEDEVTIIRAVLDLKEKPVGTVMTPMEDVFVMSEDAVLDEKTMDRILSEGYSRVPIHASGSPTNFVGMLLVKILITYDPEDCKLVKEFPLATLPETRPETSCLDIVNFFQEGKSHMVLVSETPGDNHGAIGVVTLEDVIEELIGEEIIDESDVYVDVHKAIRRLTPAPKARPPRPNSSLSSFADEADNETPRAGSVSAIPDAVILSCSPKTTTFLMRRASGDHNGDLEPIAVKVNLDDMKRQLKHLGPSNPAANPKNTRSTAVKVKHGLGTTTVQIPLPQAPQPVRSVSASAEMVPRYPNEADEETEATPLLTSKWTTGKGGVQAIRKIYGANGRNSTLSRLSSHSGTPDVQSDQSSERQNATATASAVPPALEPPAVMTATIATPSPALASPPMSPQTPSSHRSNGSLSSARFKPATSHVISGGLTENVILTGDVQKIVIQANSSGEDDNGDSPSGYLAKQNSWSSISRPEIPETNMSEASEGAGSAGKSVESLAESPAAGEDGEDSSGVATGDINEGQSNGNSKSKKKNRRKKRKGHS